MANDIPFKANVTMGDRVDGAFRLLDIMPYAIREDIANLIYLHMHDPEGYMQRREAIKGAVRGQPSPAMVLNQSALLDALSFVAIKETQRAVGQALEHFKRTGETTSPNGTYDTTFRLLFKTILESHFGGKGVEGSPEANKAEHQE